MWIGRLIDRLSPRVLGLLVGVLVTPIITYAIVIDSADRNSIKAQGVSLCAAMERVIDEAPEGAEIHIGVDSTSASLYIYVNWGTSDGNFREYRIYREGKVVEKRPAPNTDLAYVDHDWSRFEPWASVFR